MKIIFIAALIIIALFLAFLFYAFIQTLLEKENRATKRLALLNLLSIALILILLLWPAAEVRSILVGVLGLSLFALALVIFVPWPGSEWEWKRGRPNRIDERNIMFSRAELVPGTDRYNSYYKEFPDHKKPDDEFRKLAGLLSEDSSFYNPYIFGAADATFYTVESLHPKTDGVVAETKKGQDIKAISRFIKQWAMEMGCHSVGYTVLNPHHLYHTGGRKHNYGEPVKNDHKFAIAFTVEMDFQRVKSAPRGPIIMESSAQYLRAGTIAVQLAAFIRQMGFPASAHIDGKYQVRCPEVAKDAGLGELGRMSLLMTPVLGPRVRIGVITTDLPLQITQADMNPGMLKFCRICKKCAETCPAQAISYSDPEEIGGTKQWVVNQESCFSYWCRSGTDCGRCISVCPYSHPDNLLHNIVRKLIRTSPLFLRFALIMDNWLYGRKPPEKELPEWMKSS